MSSSFLSPNAVKTALDTVLFPKFNTAQIPQIAYADTASIFNQDSADSGAVVTEIFKGTGGWEEKAEEADINGGSFKTGNTKTFTVAEFARSLDIPRTFAADAKFSLVNKAVSDMGMRGRTTRDKQAMGLYRGGFTVTKTNDGQFLFDDAHALMSLGTVDNKTTAVLTETSLYDGTVALSEQKAQDGEIAGNVPAVLLVSPKLFKLAVEITKSSLRSGTANNDMNIFYSDLYNIEVRQSNFLGAAAGGSDTAWYLLADTHAINRYKREELWTEAVDWKNQRNNNYIYKGGYREVCGALDYVGAYGSTGA